MSDEIIALAMSLDLTPAEAEQDIKEEGNNTYDYCGKTYFVGTEEEATERARDYVDEELWKMAVADNRTSDGFDEWQEDVIRNDGFGQIMNRNDGTEDTQEINGTWYYVIQV